MNKSICFRGCLFDLDGTLIDSMPSVLRARGKWAQRHGRHPDEVFSVIHGRPARESLTQLMHGQPEEVINAEFAWLEHIESTDTQGTTLIPGALEFLAQLDHLDIPWAIVTSGTLPVAKARIQAAGIRQPDILITPEQISRGKPHPEPYLLGAEKLQLDVKRCIVFEDVPAGIHAGLAAGSKVVAILSHMQQSDLPEVDAFVTDFSQLQVRQHEGKTYLYFKNH